MTPCPASHWKWASLASPITVAPARRASWTASEPTPPVAPETTTVSPSVRLTARTAAQAVAPATNSAPATSQGTPAGLPVRCCASTTTYSAWLARLSVQPITSSPAEKLVTPGLASATIPARSLPSPDGNVAGHLACIKPSRILASPGLIPAALTWTRTCPAPGTGRGTSTTFRTSIPPYSSNLTAFTGALLSSSWRGCHPPRPPWLFPLAQGTPGH